MHAKDTFTSVTSRYSLGVDSDTGRPYLSIPVTTGVADYEEFYLLTDDEYDRFGAVENDAARFAGECRERRHDDRLIVQPGWNRGTAM